MKRLMFLVLGCVLAFSSLVRAEVMTGQMASDFTLNDTNGQAQALSAYKGEYIVLEWFNHDCPFVKKHYDSNNMQSLQKEYTAKGVVWLSINSSAPGKEGYYEAAQMQQLMEAKNAAPTAVLLDPDGIAGRLYGAQATPHMFVIDPNGMLIYQGAIDDIPSVDVADIPKAINYVRAALDAAMAGQPVAVSTTKSYGCSVKYGKY